LNALTETIRAEIPPAGAITFARFMELALYHPEPGYYERAPHPVGKVGDFFTSVSVGSLFGELLAFQFAEWMQHNLKGAPFHLIEAGAHDGRLAADILKWLRLQRPELSAAVQFWIVEPSTRRRSWQEETLHDFKGQIQWAASFSELPRVRGIIFSNELLDAFPVHRLAWDAKANAWFEWGVAFENDRFAWSRMTLASAPSELRELPTDLLAVLPDGFIVELCPAATEWWRSAASVLDHGKLVTFDYGLTRDQLLSPERTAGTLRAYHHHHADIDLLANVGDQDLTAHVDFSAIQQAGEAAGLKTAGLFRQEQFLTRIAEQAFREPPRFGEWTAARKRQFQTLTHPEQLGRSFKALVQVR